MKYIKCDDCGKIYEVDLEACPHCGLPTEYQQQPQEVETASLLTEESMATNKNTMPYIKCNECGKIYKTSLEGCPHCGYPTNQQPTLPTFDETTPINITEILSIKEDKFEETKDTKIFYREILSSSIDDLCQSLETKAPTIFLSNHIEKGVGQLQVCYFEAELLEKIESINDKDLADKYGWACRRMIINIDDKENIRLDLENNESIWAADFPITQEQFLKCCKAKKLEFKITKENGKSIIVNGYYGFDPETGVEIDVNGDVVPENDLILNFQALYNYVIDPNMFKDALRKRQMYDEWIKRKNEELEAIEEQEEKELDKKLEEAKLRKQKLQEKIDRLENVNTKLNQSGCLVSGALFAFLGIILLLCC